MTPSAPSRPRSLPSSRSERRVAGRRRWLGIGVAAACVALAIGSLLRGGPRHPRGSVESALIDEFARAYDTLPEAARPGRAVRAYTLDAAPIEIPLVDGRPTRVWAYNGQVPGPVLRVRLGETLRVHFTNHLPQPTTIHWHGVRVPNAMDGVPGVTQPPIEPGQSFTYEFAPRDAGTYWFHPHLRGSEQVERGLYGVLIVEDANPPPYSRELIWVLDDILLTPDHQIDEHFNTRHDLMHDGRWGNAIVVNGRQSDTVQVRPGERLRVRLLNAANGRVFAPDLAGYNVEAIAVDGKYARAPFSPLGFELAPGNRLDLDLRIPPEDRGKRYTIVDRYAGFSNPLITLDVSDEPPLPTPDFPSPARAHVPTWRPADALPPRAEYRLNSRLGGPYGIEWTLNGVAFAGHDHAAMLHHPIERFPRGAFTKLRFTNDSYRIHPMHMHGVYFKLLSRNAQPIDEPHFRDTVLVHPRETVEIGLIPFDPGKWMMHCHIQEHAEAGMMTLFEVD